MIMCIQTLVGFCPFILKIWSKTQILTSIKGRNPVAILRKITHCNPKIDLVNDNEYKKFGLNASIPYQDIEQIQNNVGMAQRERERERERGGEGERMTE